MNKINEISDNLQDNLENDELWDVIYSYFKDKQEDKKNKLPYKKNYYMTNHHLDSYNDFILNKIPKTLKESNPQTIFLEREEDKDYKYKYEKRIFYFFRFY